MLSAMASQIAAWTGGSLHGADVRVSGVASDSRQLPAGSLFIALRGEHHDAHDFVAAAAAAGASAALVDHVLPAAITQVVVADVGQALADLATAWRGQYQGMVIGITGSSGKTTVKSLLGAILQRHGRCHVTSGNFNNEIGLPLSVLAMPQDSEYAVLEMGAGQPGDIASLVRIAQPQYALITNIGAAHLERMGSVEGVAETKGALYSMLPADGVAIINADDAFAAYFRGLAGSRRSLDFSVGSKANVTARLDAQPHSGRFVLVTADAEFAVQLPLRGRHNVANALAAAAVAIALDVPLATIKAGLEAAPAVAGRSIRHARGNGALLIDDTYNANPASFAAAIAMLAAERGDSVLVMGDMRELGSDGERLHAEVGALAKHSGIHRLHAVGELSRAAVDAFGAGARHYPDQAALIRALEEELRATPTILIKGSRGSAMDRVVAALLHGGRTEGDHHAA